MASSKYKDMLLVAREDGTQAIVIAPISVATEGDIVIFGNAEQGTVVRSEWVNPEDNMYQIIEATVPLHTAKRIYSYRLKWEEEPHAEELCEDT